MKGQVTFVNLIAVVITLIVYFMFIPILQPMIDSTAVYLNSDPNSTTPILIVMLDFLPFILLLSIVLTAINYAVPKREGY